MPDKNKELNELVDKLDSIEEMGDPPILLRTRFNENRFITWAREGFKEWISHLKLFPFLMLYIYGGVTYLAFVTAIATKCW